MKKNSTASSTEHSLSERIRNHYFIPLGTLLIVVLVVVMVMTTVSDTRQTRSKITQTMEQYDRKAWLAAEMHLSAYNRAIILSHMLLIGDPLEFDNILETLSREAARHIRARTELLALTTEADELAILNRAIERTRVAAPVIAESISLLSIDEIAAARALWINNGAIDAHQEALEGLLQLRQLHDQKRHEFIDYSLAHQAKASHRTIYIALVTLVLILLIVGRSIYLLKHASELLEQRVEERTQELQHEIIERKEAEKQLHHMAHFDSLTGLPNRFLFMQELRNRLSDALRHETALALFFIDLDHFKRINDMHGHEYGDALLKSCASRLKHVLRDHDIAARLGGDEFTVIIQQFSGLHEIRNIAKRMHLELSAPYLLESHELVTSPSIGIALFPDEAIIREAHAHNDNPQEQLAYIENTLLRNADIAMYNAKQQGRSQFRFFDEDIGAMLTHKMKLTEIMRHALDRGEFYLLYQPQLSVIGNEMLGVEALLRWSGRLEGEEIPPDQFIPVLEECGAIIDVGRWVLTQAATQLRRWHRQGHSELKMAVNLSVRQFSTDNIVEAVSDTLKECKLPPHCLELEITESLMMEPTPENQQKLNQLKQMGIRLAMDDFGTGFSSLGSLRSLDLHTNKIDQVFMRNIPFDPEDLSLVRSIISISQNLGMTVLAEGVETEEQLSFLRESGCDEYQGYLFSRPVAAEKIEALLQQKSVN